jgi:phosphoglycerate dehydrogenase-like enzyme
MTTMALQHLLPTYVLNQSRSSWNRDAQAAHCVRELRGSTMGVLGYGHIGRECARMAKALGMNVVAATRSGKKSKIGGYLTEGTGDHDGGEF